MSKLLEIIQLAENAIDMYRHPNLDEFRAAVDPVLAALGQCTVDGDKVESISIGQDYVSITTSYSCRGCHNTNDSTIPMSIVEAADPVRAATERTLRKNLAKAVDELVAAKARIPRLEELSNNAAATLAEFLKTSA